MHSADSSAAGDARNRHCELKVESDVSFFFFGVFHNTRHQPELFIPTFLCNSPYLEKIITAASLAEPVVTQWANI